jgi:serine/threonine protein kinase/tetratricopeptide (TPR) repeat protein
MSTWNPHANEIFLNALELAEAGDRKAYLIEVCAGDAGLRAEVESLLAAHEDSSRLFDSPAGSITVAAAAVAELPSTVIGRYKLLEQIGEGGMGLVYMAEQTEPVRRRVALKIIKPGMDSRQIIGRFEAERQALAMMDHPNIARVIDGGQTDTGRPFFVMELVRGTPITEYCDGQRLTTRDRLQLFRQVCAAVQHAHQKGIIHRDIKPSNVLVASNDGVPTVKVIDFGIAKAIGQPLTDKTVFTHFVQFVGTPAYMSPEQAGQSSIDVDTRTDVYALGVLLYELLTGTTPFEKERLKSASYDEIRRLIREEDPPRPSTRMSTLNEQAGSTVSAQRQSSARALSLLLRGELDWIVMKSLEKDRNRRYESASAFAADIEQYLNDEPVQACPPSVRYRFGKFVRRNRRSLLSAVLAAVAVIVLAVVIGFSFAERANRLTRTEQQARESLAGARTAIEAGDLTLAQQRVAEVLAVLGTDREGLRPLIAEADQLQREIEDRQSDAARMRRFLQLASDAQDKMSRGGELGGDIIAQQALDLYGVLDNDHWCSRLDNSYLTPEQKTKVRETAYIALVSLADWCVRWTKNMSRVDRAAQLLMRAEAFHAPTRAFYFVRSEYHSRKGDDRAARLDMKRFQETRVVSPWDHYLPGHTAGWNGDLDEAIRSYQAALDLQPDHYNSLLFLGYRLQKQGRFAEAIAYFRACELLRPNEWEPYMGRLECYAESGQFTELEDQIAFLRNYIRSPDRRAESTLSRLNDLGPRLMQLQPEGKTAEANFLASTLAVFGRALLGKGRYPEAEPILRECLGIRNEYAATNWLRFNAQSMLGEALLGQNKIEEAERHLLEGYQGVIARRSTIPITIRAIREREAEDRVIRFCDRWGKKDAADHWRAALRNSYIREWLLLSEALPYDGKKVSTVLDQRPIADEEELRPRAGDPIQVGDRNLTWKIYRSADKYIDLKDAYSNDQERVTYMACYIHVNDDVSAMLSVAQDDHVKVYLDGKDVYRALEYRDLSVETTPIKLKRGSNRLLVKVINDGGAWGAIVRVWRTDGHPTKGIEFRLTP